MLTIQLNMFIFLSMSVTVMGSAFVVRGGANNEFIKYWNSSLSSKGVQTACNLNNLYPITGNYDFTRNVFVVGFIQSPKIGLCKIIPNGIIKEISPLDLSSAAQLISVVTTPGFVFALVQDVNNQFLYKIDTDATFNNDANTYQLVGQAANKTMKFIVGIPLTYDYSSNKFYTEVEFIASDYQRQMIEISIENTTMDLNFKILDWLTGWSKLWYLSCCPKHIIGFVKGKLYSIDIVSNKLQELFSPPSLGGDLGSNPHIDIIPSTGEIYTLTKDGDENWKLSVFDFSGSAGQVITLTTSDNTLTGLQMITQQTVIFNCPNKAQPGPTSLLSWLVDYGLATIIVLGAGLLLALAIGGLILLKVSRRANYSEIVDKTNKRSGRAATEVLHDALLASGGKIDAEEIDVKDLIGHGSFANVYYGLFHDTEVAIKVIKFVSMRDMEKSLLEEAGLMVKLRHPHIVLFMGACVKAPDLFIVTEYMENGSIREILDQKSVTIEEEHIRVMAIDACKGMAFLHSRKILHRDLKSHNLLVDKFWNVKVADFGLSRAMGDTEGTMTACGTPSWAAPEVLRRDHYSFMADVYSFGVCLWEMCTRQRPYAELKPYQVVIAVATDGLRPTIDPKVVPPYFEKILRQCWNDKPDERPEFPRIREALDAISCPLPRTPNPSYQKRKDDVKSSSAPIIDGPRSSNSSKEMKTRKKFYEQIE